MSTKVRAGRTELVQRDASCLDCGWLYEGLGVNPRRVLKQARIHFAANPSHQVHVETVYETTIGERA